MKKIGIIGTGRLGHALARALCKKGYPISGINDKDSEKAALIAKELALEFIADQQTLIEKSDALFLAVPDSLIVHVSENIISICTKPLILLQPSGALSAYDLPSSANITRGSFHPLQSFVKADTVFEDIYITMDGDEEALSLAKDLCRTLGGKPLLVPPADRALYHAAACMASNYLVTLLSEVEDIFMRWADSPEEARKAFWPLIKGTANNFEKLGKSALTGPIARGDLSTLQKHLAILPDEYRKLYLLLGQYTADLADEQNMITKERAHEIKSFFKGAEK